MACLATTIACAGPLLATVKSYTHPSTLPSGLAYSTTYSVRVKGQNGVWRTVPVYDADPNDLYQTQTAAISGWNPGVFCQFDTDEINTMVEVTYGSTVTKAVVHPKSKRVAPAISGSKVTMNLGPSSRVGLDVNNNIGRPLWIFANSIEATADVPTQGASGVFYVPAGTVYDAASQQNGNTSIDLTNYHTLYVAGGAVLKGCITGAKANTKILGRGVVLAPPQSTGSTSTDLRQALWTGGDSLTIKGLTFIGQAAGNWSCGMIGVAGLTVSEVKVIGVLRDGFNLIGVNGGTVSDSFFYSYDDCLAIKAKSWSNNIPNKDITIQRCVMWNHAVSIGFESQCDLYDNIVINDCDFIRPRSNNEAMPDEENVNSRVPMMGVTVADRANVTRIKWSNIRVYDPVNVDLFSGNVSGNYASADTTRGSIDGVTLENIQILDAAEGQPLEFVLNGYDSSHMVKNVTVDNLQINGIKVLNGYDLGAWIKPNVGTWSITDGNTIYAPINKNVAIRCNSNSKYADPGSDAAQEMTASATEASLASQNYFKVEWSSSDGKIGLRNYHNNAYAQLVNGGANAAGDPLKAVSSTFAAWEKYTPKRVDQAPGFMVLRAANGMNLAANPNGTSPITAPNTNESQWAQFYLDEVTLYARPGAGSKISLKALANYQYVNAQNNVAGTAGQGLAALAHSSAVSSKEKLTIVASDGGRVAIRSSSTSYLSSENGLYAMRANRSAVGNYEKFTIVSVDAGKIALKATNGKYVGVRYHAPYELWADRDTITQESTFIWATAP
jgi:hypothetical protein